MSQASQADDGTSAYRMDPTGAHVTGLVNPDPPSVEQIRSISPSPNDAVGVNAGGATRRSPFNKGQTWNVSSDENYSNGSPHPTNGFMAVDIYPVTNDFEVRAITDGLARVTCVTQNMSIVMLFDPTIDTGDWTDSLFYYVHVDPATLPFYLSTNYWIAVPRGAYLGEIWDGAGNQSDGNGCTQFSTGPHLHLDVPLDNISIDGVTYNPSGVDIGDQLTSTNQLTCWGERVTVELGKGETPTSGADVIYGTAFNDTINAKGGDDVVCGYDGDDDITGGSGDDSVRGGRGDDTINLGNGNDRVRGNGGDDIISGGDGNDRLYSNAGSDQVDGGSGSDKIRGGSGPDILNGDGGKDDIGGGAGGDTINGGSAADIIDGGPGSQDSCPDVNGSDTATGCELP